MNIVRFKPKLMAIGDSLAQGCRSLTVKASFCAQSWSARIAQAQSWKFAVPDHREAVLFDLEMEIRRLDPVVLSPQNLSFIGLGDRVRNNFHRWCETPGRSAYECFDNLGVAGSEVHDLYSLTSGDCAKIVNEAAGKDTRDWLKLAQELHLPINARFVLNPQQKAAYDKFSPLDWVDHRQPETLLVQTGHNHGLFPFGFEAKDQPTITKGDHDGLDYWGQWQKVAERLANLPASTKHILVMLLPKVGGVAELHPTSPKRFNGYAPFYEPRILPVANILRGARVAEIDRLIQEVNRTIEKIVRDAAKMTGTENRLTFVDAYQELDSLDYKNSLDPKRQLKLTGKITIDNRYLDGKPNFPDILGGKLTAGGFQSVDGMHPSGVGYADLASQAMTALGLPHSSADREKLLRRAYDEDTLLSQYPLELDMLVRIVDITRSLIHRNQFVPAMPTTAAEEPHLALVLPALARAVS